MDMSGDSRRLEVFWSTCMNFQMDLQKLNHNINSRGNDIEFSFPVTGDEDTAAGNCLWRMDRNRGAGSRDRRYCAL